MGSGYFTNRLTGSGCKTRPERMFEVDRTQRLDWDTLRAKVQKDGMRNSNVMAIAPTATISNICGVSQSIEPTFQNLYVKSNLSGEFTVINPYLVRALKERGLWDAVMVNDLKHFEGSVQKISRIPEELKAIFATAFEVETRWIVDAASRRQNGSTKRSLLTFTSLVQMVRNWTSLTRWLGYVVLRRLITYVHWVRLLLRNLQLILAH